MNDIELICPAPALNNRRGWFSRTVVGAASLAIGTAVALSGCISVNAPDKPIVIELNMSIKMDVVYKLSGDVAKTVDSNKEIF